MQITIFTDDVREHLKNTTKESAVSLQNFEDTLESRMSDTSMVIVANNWHLFGEKDKLRLAIHHAGLFHLSRFIVLMNYLNEKINS